MNHRTELELIAYFYGESSQPGEDRQHLETCRECAEAYEALARELPLVARQIEEEPVPARADGYGEVVWRSLEPSLVAYEKKRPHRLREFSASGFLGSGFLGSGLLGSGFLRSGAGLKWTLASAAVLVVLIAFFFGRLWEQKFSPRRVADEATVSGKQGKPSVPVTAVQPVIVVLLSDHLERSERLLVELNHPEEAVVDPALQTTARQLLAENRRYQKAASEGGDEGADVKSQASSNAKPGENNAEVKISPAMTLALDDLDRVLAQVADRPDGLSRAELAQVKQQINASGLLFEVRVLRSRNAHVPTSAATTRREGSA
jgi:hypothetical protein